MSVATTYYNNEAIFSFTSETAFTLPSYNSRAVITLKNLSSPSLTFTPFGSETIDGASTLVLGSYATAKLVKGVSGWVVAEGADTPLAGALDIDAITASTSVSTGALIVGTNVGIGGTLGGTSYFGGDISALGLIGPGVVDTTTAVGSAFTNQPANDGVEIVSSDAADTTQTATVIGTTTGTDTVVVESVVLTGATFAPTVKTDWGVILAVKLSASCAGTVTFREASGNATIVTLATTVLSAGVTTVTTTTAFNKGLALVSDGATTKQLGLKGTDSAGAVQYDSQALAGAVPVQSNSSFLSLTEIYRGDIEVGRTATVSAGKGATHQKGTATNDDPAAGDIGELLTAQLAAASTTSLTTATAKTIISKALTAGDWELTGVVHFVPANTTTIAGLVASFSATDNTAGNVDSVGGYANSSAVYTSTGVVNSVTVPAMRVSVGVSTTYYLVATATFGVATCTGYGTLRARRLR